MSASALFKGRRGALVTSSLLAVMLLAPAHGSQSLASRIQPTRTSLGIGVNRNGLLLEAAWYDPLRWHHGFYVGLGGWARDEDESPHEGSFSWVDYDRRSLAWALSLHGGYSWQVLPGVAVGVGLGLSQRHYWLIGTSSATGWEWRVDGPTDSMVGVHGWAECPIAEEIGLRFQWGPARMGASIQWRLDGRRAG